MQMRNFEMIDVCHDCLLPFVAVVAVVVDVAERERERGGKTNMSKNSLCAKCWHFEVRVIAAAIDFHVVVFQSWPSSTAFLAIHRWLLLLLCLLSIVHCPLATSFHKRVKKNDCGMPSMMGT